MDIQNTAVQFMFPVLFRRTEKNPLKEGRAFKHGQWSYNFIIKLGCLRQCRNPWTGRGGDQESPFLCSKTSLLVFTPDHHQSSQESTLCQDEDP